MYIHPANIREHVSRENRRVRFSFVANAATAGQRRARMRGHASDFWNTIQPPMICTSCGRSKVQMQRASPYAYEKTRSFFRKNEQRVEGRISPFLSLSLSLFLARWTSSRRRDAQAGTGEWIVLRRVSRLDSRRETFSSNTLTVRYCRNWKT